jgi:TRAP-type C4-dicarboxylate transport system permease small subunit
MGKIIAILLIAGGALGLLYGGFTYTKDTHSAKLGSVVIAVQEKETVYVPVILSAAALALGVALLLTLRNK